eukprot:TRINITY_DN29959_c0_g1_i1.p1 TRINITY_DN29959_c0_g1~~TRINITY_DN29959_c0_g1_i1.p1  ORF type:complete len:442 (+),score=216.34 TRINITY_DN29959_c0_g1_i1:72-1397(+)
MEDDLTLEEVLKMEKELSKLDTQGMGKLFGDLGDMDGLDDEGMEVQREQMLAEMRKYEENEGSWKRDAKKWAVTINAALITERCIDKAQLAGMGEEERISAILGVTHLHLDGAGLDRIENLEIVSNATHMFVQNNNISSLPNEFDWLTKLTHLNLAHNQLEKIEHLTVLDTLVALDVSYNKLRSLEVEELPRALETFDYRGNIALEAEEDEDKFLLSPLTGALRVCLLYLRELNGEEMAPMIEELRGEGAECDAPAVEDDAQPSAVSSSTEAVPAASSSSVGVSRIGALGTFEASGFKTEVNSIRDKLLTDHVKRRAERDRMLDHIINADVEDVGAADIDAFIAQDKVRRDDRSVDASFDVCGSIHEAVMHHKNVSTAGLDDELDAYRKDIAKKKEAVMERSKARRVVAEAGESATLQKARKELQVRQDKREKAASAAGRK